MGVLVLSGVTLLASSDSQNRDASQWTADDVYRILHNSPWTKTVKVSHSERGLANDNGAAVPNNNSRPAGSTPGRMGGMGRRGGGGTVSNSSTSSSKGSSGSNSSTEEVIIQWQSALPVRLASAKDTEQDLSTVANQAPNEYLIGVIGIRLSDIGGPGARLDSSTPTEEETESLKNHLMSGASLLRGGHEPLAPSKVELDQGKDGRIVFHFPKSDPITSKDKAVEFRINTEGSKIQKKFILKEMEYENRLEL